MRGGAFGVVEDGFVGVVPEVASTDKAVTAIVAGATGDEDASASRGWVDVVDGLRDGEASKFH